MAAHLARAAARALRVSPAGPPLPARPLNFPSIMNQTRGMAGGAGEGVTHEGLTLHEPLPIHKNMATGLGAIMWFWIFYRFKEDGATLIYGHQIHFEHDDDDDHH